MCTSELSHRQNNDLTSLLIQATPSENHRPVRSIHVLSRLPELRRRQYDEHFTQGVADEINVGNVIQQVQASGAINKKTKQTLSSVADKLSKDNTKWSFPKYIEKM